MTNYEIWNLVIQTIVALGTLGAIIVAIWGSNIRSKVVGPLVDISLRSRRPNLTQGNGKRVHYYHLKISNKRPSSPAIRGRVLVQKIYKQDARGEFTDYNLLTVPLQLTWVNPQLSIENKTYPVITIVIWVLFMKTRISFGYQLISVLMIFKVGYLETTLLR